MPNETETRLTHAAALPAAAGSFAPSPLAHGYLLRQMTLRDIKSRYRGSALGLLWSFLTPLLMLAVYTFVFSVVFKARWGGHENSDAIGGFAVTLFSGLIIHAFFADCVARAPGIVLQHPNFVKKVIFPLEILPLMLVGSALFHFGMNMVVLLGGIILTQGTPPITALLLPLVVAPLVLQAAGLCWLLASIGVFLRDIGQLVGLALTVLLFLSPVFYPVEALPERLRGWLYFNPLTVIIENARAVMIAGALPDWKALGAHALASAVILVGGYAWFVKTRKGFADVV